MRKTVYEFSAVDIDGNLVTFDKYKNNVLLIVNTASKCGFTKQYAKLEEVYLKYKDRGLIVLGFPCNQFGSQEPGDPEEIKRFCSLNYNVTFPMFSKIEVNGENAHELFKFLKKKARGAFGTKSIKWNFTKFLVNKNGNVVKRFAPITPPLGLAKDIEKLL